MKPILKAPLGFAIFILAVWLLHVVIIALLPTLNKIIQWISIQ